MKENERRYRQIYISPHLLLQFLSWKEGQLLRLPIIDLENFQIVNIDFSTKEYAFTILITHPSFDPVPIGQAAPLMNYDIKSFLIEPVRY